MKLTLRMALVALALAPLTPAFAADYDPPIYVDQAPDYVPVEVGSGWYLRGDVAYSINKSYKNSSLSVDDSLFDNNLVGLGWAGPLDEFSSSENQNPVSGSVGFGYHFNDYLRADINVGLLSNNKSSGAGNLFAGYLDPFSFVDQSDLNNHVAPDFGCLGKRTVTKTTFDAGGNQVGTPVVAVDPDWRRDCIVSASAKSTAWNGLANGYIDLGTYAGFTPYVGAGIGVLLTQTKASATSQCEAEEQTTSNGTTTTTTTFLCRGQTSPSDAPVNYAPISYSKTNYDFLYGLSAGFSYQVAKNTSLDFGYQYISAPSIKYYSVSADGIESHKGMSVNQVKVGLRYDLW
jgi:opacity protein-like surface antigen